MKASHIEFLVEESSSEVALNHLLPSLLGNTTFTIHPHQGKDDLLKKLPGKLDGYSRWLPGDWRIVVLLDCDDDLCVDLKARLESMAKNAGLTTLSQARNNRTLSTVQVLNRIAIEELEAWFFGDWDAVCAAYPRCSPSLPSRAAYRDPDAIRGGTWESLERELQASGYHLNGLPKKEFARTVASHMDPTRNRSRSFQVFIQGLASLRES